MEHSAKMEHVVKMLHFDQMFHFRPINVLVWYVANSPASNSRCEVGGPHKHRIRGENTKMEHFGLVGFRGRNPTKMVGGPS